MGKAYPWRGRSLGDRVDLPCAESVHVRCRGNQCDHTWCDEKPEYPPLSQAVKRGYFHFKMVVTSFLWPQWHQSLHTPCPRNDPCQLSERLHSPKTRVLLYLLHCECDIPASVFPDLSWNLPSPKKISNRLITISSLVVASRCHVGNYF